MPRGGAKQRVDSRPGKVLARTPRQTHPTVLDQHVPVGRGDVNVAFPDRLLFARMRSGEFARSSQQIGEYAAALPDMSDDKNRTGKFCWKHSGDRTERVEAAGRRADRDHIAPHQMAGAGHVSGHRLRGFGPDPGHRDLPVMFDS
jgi:hypothetical protein